jgi:hypothetical protein
MPGVRGVVLLVFFFFFFGFFLASRGGSLLDLLSFLDLVHFVMRWHSRRRWLKDGWKAGEMQRGCWNGAVSSVGWFLFLSLSLFSFSVVSQDRSVQRGWGFKGEVSKKLDRNGFISPLPCLNDAPA